MTKRDLQALGSLLRGVAAGLIFVGLMGILIDTDTFILPTTLLFAVPLLIIGKIMDNAGKEDE